MIANVTIDKVRELPIVEVLSHFVQVKRQGASYVCCCPFHGEKTPSLNISPAKNLWHCFGCGKGGDAIAFVMELQGIDFQEAVTEIAKRSGVPVEYVKSEKSEEQQQEDKRREAMHVALTQVQEFFIAQMEGDTEEGERARAYAYGRWPLSFCQKVGIGYAPKNGRTLMQYCQQKAIPADALMEVGLLKTGEDGHAYALLRERVTIPIYSRTNKIIGFTARAIGESKVKYLNLPNSPVFNKSAAVFGINVAARKAREMGFLILVEGAPDVLRLQSLGLGNAVATLGTAWTAEHFDTLERITKSLCFVPDSDPPKNGDTFGAGFLAVMRNGAEAMRRGFDVTVRELPMGSDAEGNATKNDADSYINTPDTFYQLEERHFAVWLAEKRFASASTLLQKREAVNEVAQLLSHIEDRLLLDECTEQLAKVYGKPRMWRDAAMNARAEREGKDRQVAQVENVEPTLKELLKKFNLYIRNNMYFSAAEEQPTRLSNFILEPMYHIKDDCNGTRIFKIRNEYNVEEVVEFREAELVSLTNFQQKVGSLGNFIWKAKIDKLNVVKELLYTLTDTAELVKQMGWDAVNGFYTFGNGILKDGEFMKVDNLGIVRIDAAHKYYIPATSVMYRHNPAIFQFERLFTHESRSAITLYDFSQKVVDVFGDNGKIGLCFLFASLFRDIIYPIKNCFPILNLFGLKGTGKTSLATTLQSFFIHGIDPPSIAVTSIPSMNDRVSQVTNAMVVFDEYKNDIDERKIAYLKALWGGTGQVKKNMNGDGKAAHTVVTAAVCICGQDLPTRDIALYSRVIHLTFSRPSFTQEERRRYDELKDIGNRGNTHLAIEVLNQRKVMENGFKANYSLVRKELSNELENEEIEDRVLDNWVVPLATFRTLESALRLPFTYTELFDITLAGIRYQNEGCKKNTEMAEFWEVIDSLHSQGRIIEKAHFRIKYLTEFRAIGRSEAVRFAKAKPVLFLNAPAVSSLYSGRIPGGVTAGRTNNWSTVMTYLKVQPSFLGLKQDRFNLLLPNGTFDYSIENEQGNSVRKMKVNRPKALCFDYEMLKEKYSLNLETSSMRESEMDDEDATTEVEQQTAQQQGEIPF